MSYMNIFYPESRFGSFTDIDGTIIFYTRVNELLNPSFVVLDVGCGNGAYSEDIINVRRNLKILKGKVKKVIGIDIDKEASNNPYIDDFFLISTNTWPVDNNSIDLILCDNVLEHIEKPDSFFSEADRVLKNGGYICIRTPNLWNYIAIFSKLIPDKLHFKIVKLVQEKRSKGDMYPTYYRCNSIWKLQSMFKRYDYDHIVYGYEAEPSYLSFSKFFYWLGILHQKFAPGFVKPAIFAFGKKR